MQEHWFGCSYFVVPGIAVNSTLPEGWISLNMKQVGAEGN